MHQRIILQHLPKPPRSDLTTDAYWLCDTLGLSSGRDTEDLSIRIVLRLLQETTSHGGIQSEALAQILGISSGRVNHHLRNLSRSGFVYRERKQIYLRGQSLAESVKELRKDADRIFDELEKVATEIDEIVGLRIAHKGHEESRALIPRNPYP
ncbi:MAG TPA: winged helix-turn-helix transcriptional regulator [Methanospirillum sp.]|nr:winged helix-turn-helix transcriptional regulator [Methanospirillum sp.]